MHRKLVLLLALVGPLTVVLLAAPSAGALPLPPLAVPTVPVAPLLAAPLPQVPLPQLPLPLPTAPSPSVVSPAVTLPAVTLSPPQLLAPGATGTVADVLAPPTAQLPAPSAPTPGPPALSRAGSARTADAGAGASAQGAGAQGTGAGSQPRSSGGGPASVGNPTASAPAPPRPFAGVSGRRVSARQNVAGEPALVSTTQPRGYYFGWFGLFMAFTGRDILGMLHLAVVALCVGLGSMVAARHMLRPT